ncbi:hypothetical protein [Cohnella sp. 56]|uniref:hypothetical protein n=1 Tax=Cohnella sp. 56 TaxID=3113722 RepID=UPI0030E90ECA
MEVYKWLEPSIKARVKEIKEDCKIKYRKTFSEFEKVHQDMLKSHPEVFDELLRLETLFIEKDQLIDHAYRCGFRDGVELLKYVQSR